MQTIKEYYDNKANLNEIFNSVENPNWHQWKVQDTTGTFRSNTKKINTINKLRKFIGNKPGKVYISIAQFLHPETTYGKTTKKAQWKVADSLFLKSDLLFDLDSEEDLSIAHEDGKKLIEYMKGTSYELLNIRFSGKKGFHLLYRDNEPIKEKDPIKRLERTEQKRKDLIKKLPQLNTIDDLHKNICADQFRVHATIGTVKASTGCKVSKISEEEFMLSSITELKRLICQRVVRREPMIKDDSILTSINEEERPTLSSYSFQFIDNLAKGTKGMYATVLKYPLNKDVTQTIKNVQKLYKLDSFYKFIYKDIQMYINFKLLDKRRLEKIMKYSKPMNLNSFMYYNHTWIPISESKDKEGNIISEKPILKEILGSVYGVNDTHSRPHANLLNLKFKNMAGNKMNKICRAMVEER